jgi:cytochrome c oxidase cbb3-type subunit 3
MNRSHDENLMDHEYDGIREYDNPMPSWWVWTFILTVVYSAGYVVYYTAPMPERTVIADYEMTVAADLKQRFAGMGELVTSAGALNAYMKKADYIAVGKSVFMANCVSCHAVDGSGLVGPNLTDDAYKNVKVITDLPQVINTGANNGAMPAWKNRLHPNEVALVAAYVATLRGKNLPGPRGVEGDVIPPWSAEGSNDSDKKAEKAEQK